MKNSQYHGDYYERKRQKEMDAEATLFAMYLLMPTKLLVPEIEKLGGFDACDDAALTKLAQMFQVPLAMMVLRVKQLYDGGEIDD